MTQPTGDSDSHRALWRITTQWSRVNDPSFFVLRYADAVRRYLAGWLREPHLADDVVQQLLMQVTQRGFANADPQRGRFRDYLIAVVRNIARRSLRPSAKSGEPLPAFLEEQLADPRLDGPALLEKAWLEEWRTCLLERAFRALHAHEVDTPGNLYFSALKLARENPDAEQADLARILSRQAGRPVSHDAFRKILSRARRHLAVLVVQEVALTLQSPSAQEVEEELAALEMLNRVVPYLPTDWKTNPDVIPHPR